MYQYKLKYETRKFLEKYVFPFSQFSQITNENADTIVEFIEHRYVIPLVNDQEEKKVIDEELLRLAEDAIDDICEN